MTSFADPLSFGTENEDLEKGMEDLTAQLENVMAGSPRKDADDVFDLGDTSDLHGSLNPFILQGQENKQMPAYASYGQLVRPPAYEDSVMYETAEVSRAASVAAESSNGGPSTSTAPTEPAALLTVTVTDPVKRDQPSMFGMKGSYIAYLVTTHTALPGFSKPEVHVRRRFKDIVSLSDVLKAKYRGYFIPPRPEKNVVEGQRMKDTFIEDRRHSLERYLNRLGRHPVLARSEELRVFLEVDSDLTSSAAWAGLQPTQSSLVEGTTKLSMQLLGRERAVPDPAQAALPAGKTGDLLRAMKETMQAQRSTSYSVDELELRRQKELMEEMRDGLLAASRGAEKLVSMLDRSGTVLGELGLALFKLHKHEEADGSALAAQTGTHRHSARLAADLARSAQALVRLARLSRKVTGRSALELTVLHEHLAFMPAVLRGLNSREHQLLTQHTLEADLETKQRAVRELEAAAPGSERGKHVRLGALHGDVSALERSIGAAGAEYCKIKAANHEELQRFHVERRRDLLMMAHNLCLVQTAWSERALDVWLQLASELGATPEQVAAAGGRPVPADSAP